MFGVLGQKLWVTKKKKVEEKGNKFTDNRKYWGQEIWGLGVCTEVKSLMDDLELSFQCGSCSELQRISKTKEIAWRNAMVEYSEVNF